VNAGNVTVIFQIVYSERLREFSALHSVAASRRGFTMIEILVIIAILGFLVALIFPAYRNLASQGNTAKCTSNLRQIAGAALAWANENQGRLPDQTRWYSRSKGDQLSLFPYLGFPDTGLQVLRDTVYTCPEFQRGFPTAATPHRTYAINRYATGSHTADPADWDRTVQNSDPPQTLLGVRSPARMAFFMDGRPNTLEPRDTYSYRSYAAYDSVGPDKTPHLHQDGLNVAFLDGHVERISTAWIEQEQLTLVSRRVHPFWGAGK